MSIFFSRSSLAIRKLLLYSLAALGLFVAHNFNFEPIIYKASRDLAGVPVVCSPWTVPADDDGSCMREQRAIDVVYAFHDAF